MTQSSRSTPREAGNNSCRQAERIVDAKQLVRLHCDWGPAGGFAVYYPDRSGSTQGVTGPTEDTLRQSKADAKPFHDAFARAIAGDLKDRGTLGDSATLVGGKQGALTGSIFCKVPVVMVEMCCLNSRHDVDFVSVHEGISELASALEAGVDAALGR